MSRFPSLLALVLLPTALAAPSYAQRITAMDADRSAITFVSKQMNVPVDGKFGRFRGQLNFDPAKPTQSAVTLEVDLDSIDTGSDEANEEVKSKSWFDVKNFPTAKFTSTAVKPLGGGRYEASGKLTIKGRTNPASAPFTFKPEGHGGVFEGAFVIKRLDYGIGAGVWSDVDTVANEVQIKFRVTGTSGKPKE